MTSCSPFDWPQDSLRRASSVRSVWEHDYGAGYGSRRLILLTHLLGLAVRQHCTRDVLLEGRHHISGEQLHGVKNSLLRHAAPVKHHSQMGNTGAVVLLDLLQTPRRIAKDRERVDLFDRGRGEKLPDLGKGIIPA